MKDKHIQYYFQYYKIIYIRSTTFPLLENTRQRHINKLTIILFICILYLRVWVTKSSDMMSIQGCSQTGWEGKRGLLVGTGGWQNYWTEAEALGLRTEVVAMSPRNPTHWSPLPQHREKRHKLYVKHLLIQPHTPTNCQKMPEKLFSSWVIYVWYSVRRIKFFLWHISEIRIIINQYKMDDKRTVSLVTGMTTLTNKAR